MLVGLPAGGAYLWLQKQARLEAERAAAASREAQLVTDHESKTQAALQVEREAAAATMLKLETQLAAAAKEKEDQRLREAESREAASQRRCGRQGARSA